MKTAIEHYRASKTRTIEEANALVAAVEERDGTPTPQERARLTRLRDEAQDWDQKIKAEQAGATWITKYASLGSGAVNGEHAVPSGGLWAALVSAQFDRRKHPVVAEIDPFSMMGFQPMAAASFDGTVGEDSIPLVFQSADLGADTRFLYTAFQAERVDDGVANVSAYRQKARSLASPGSMIRSIDDTSSKPETDSEGEVYALPLSQVANVQTGVPSILLNLGGGAMRTWITADLQLGWQFALDYLVDQAIQNAGPPALSTGAPGNIYEEIVCAREQVIAAGYADPSLVALSPGDALDLQLLVQTSGDHYVFPPDLPTVRVSPILSDGGGLVADPNAAGRLVASTATFSVLEENAGATNSWTARLENHAAFAVERVDAICMLSSS